MAEREQVDLTRNFLVSLMEEQLEIQQHVVVDVTNQPIVHNGDTLRHMASRIVEEATTVSIEDWQKMFLQEQVSIIKSLQSHRSNQVISNM